MHKYVIKRLLALIPVILGVIFIIQLILYLSPSDAAVVILGNNYTPEGAEAVRESLGLNRPFLTRYLDWIGGFFRGDLGLSYHYGTPVAELVAPRLLVTCCLSLMSFLLVTAVSIPLGVWEAWTAGRGGRRRSSRAAAKLAGLLRTAWNQLFMALPPFFSGILISWIFGILLKWFQPGIKDYPTLTEAPGRFFWYLLFPAVSIAIPRIAMTVRMLHSTISGEMGRDYVRTAISRGNDRWQVLRRHVLKNAMVPVIAFLAQTMAEVVAGSIVVEQVFGVPGLGRLLLNSIGYRDWAVVQVIIVILAFWVVLAGTVGDLISQRLDPRLQLGGAK